MGAKSFDFDGIRTSDLWGLNRSAKWAIEQSVRTHMLFPLA